MRRLLISLTAAGAALAVVSPAAAQYYPAQPYGYGQGYAYNGYGYNNYGQARGLQQRIDRVEYQIHLLDRRDFIRDGRADRLRDEAQRIESRLHRAQRNGLNPYAAQDIQTRIVRLESQVHYASVGRYGRGYNDYRDRGYYNQGGDYRHDRDRDDD